MKFNQLIPELAVTDAQKSKNFYCNILGFEVVYERPEEGFAFLQLGDAQIMIDQIDIGRTWKTGDFSYPLGKGINLQIEVDTVDSLLKSLEKHEIELFMQVEEKWYREHELEWGNKQFLVQDPDGYLLRFAEDLGSRKYKRP